MRTSLVSTLITLLFMGLTLASSAQQPTIQDGEWQGAIDLNGQRLEITVTITIEEGKRSATIDIPQQGARDLPLKEVALSNPNNIHFELDAAIGRAYFDGVLKADGKRIEGTFMQNGMQFPFYLAHQAKEETTASPDYKAEELIISSNSISLAGTLTYPKKLFQRSYPTVILLTGSGAQTRDEQVGRFKVFKAIAALLADHGFAVFRYDDRGTGSSTGSLSQTTLDDHVADVKAIMERLKRHKRVDGEQIGLLGHSQGGLIAGRAVSKYPGVRFVVLMASPAYSLGELIVEQIQQFTPRAADGSDQSAPAVALQERLFEAVRNDTLPPSLLKALAAQQEEQMAQLPDSVRATLPDPEALAHQSFAMLSSPSFRSLVDYDPKSDLRTADAPLLVLLGEKDRQVYAENSAAQFRELLDTRDHPKDRLVVLDHANHLFQRAETGHPNEYTKLEPAFMKPFEEKLVNWLEMVAE